MLQALRAKMDADQALRHLLRATSDHPLLAIKPDTYWGFDARRGGRNRLTQLWMVLRDELAENDPSDAGEVDEETAAATATPG